MTIFFTGKTMEEGKRVYDDCVAAITEFENAKAASGCELAAAMSSSALEKIWKLYRSSLRAFEAGVEVSSGDLHWPGGHDQHAAARAGDSIAADFGLLQVSASSVALRMDVAPQA